MRQKKDAASGSGAGDAAGHGGVEREPPAGNFFAAGLAIAEFAVVDPGEGGVDASFPLVAAVPGGAGHRLLLHRVHARQAAYRLLIELDRALTILAAGILAIEIGERIKEDLPETCRQPIIHS